MIFALISKGTRFPKVTYPKLKALLAKRFNHSIAQEYRKVHPNGMQDGERVSFIAEGKEYSVEELVAMILKHAREQAEIMAGDIVKDVVITVC
jgi:hypoxia up-regulated 1